MFSALNQGSFVYILDKTKGIKFKIGEVIGVANANQNNYPVNQIPNQPINLKVKVEDTVYDFNAISSSASLVTYDSGKFVISETKQGLQSEVYAILQNRKNIIENIPQYKNEIVECETVLKDLNPEFAKDKERDERIDSLSTQVTNMQSTLDKIVNLISSNNSK
jgi:hypothetical protein